MTGMLQLHTEHLRDAQKHSIKGKRRKAAVTLACKYQ